MELRSLYFTWTGKMSIPVDCHKLCMCVYTHTHTHTHNIITKATSLKIVKKNIHSKSMKVEFWNVSTTHRKAREDKQQKQRENS